MAGARGDGARHPFSSIAGHPALDAVNTVHWRLSADRWDDRLEEFSDLLAWSSQFGFVDDRAVAHLEGLAQADPELAARELTQVRTLREGLYVAAYQPEQPGAELVTSEYAEAIAAGRLELCSADENAPRQWHFDIDLSLPRRRLALAAVDLLTQTDPRALGQCADEECGWVFVDTSPRSNRRWCVATDCGNRNRVRRHNERVRQTSLSE
ncbi:CGNR zinc finger domain-containing protein [Microbacterium sp. P06]|uniref:CGNR zinc finger domain-containing protein n=1 Tax=unclassified Microbacterium TaxID=2609290 RepID=UPI00374544B6